jgi:hypothetical protein
MSLKGTVWSPMGPSPIAEGTTQDNGLVSAIAVHPFNPKIIYMGTAGGGLWRTRDAGLTWVPLFDRQLSLGIGEPGALAIDPNNTDIVYAGTSGRVSAQPQAGLFKSFDAGNSWVRVGSGYPAGNTGNATQFVNQWINVVIVDPANSNVLYLGSTSGVFRSTDGGLNWTAGSNAFSDARSLVLDTSSPAGSRILYAGLSGRGVFRSNDGGQNWTQILSGSTPAVATAVGPSPNGFRKVIVALAPPTSPPNPGGVRVLYVTLQGTGGASDPVGVFISTDQGGSWTQQAAAGMPTNTQGGYSFHMAVDPASPGDGANDIIYFGTVGQAKSVNSGASFSSIPVLHADTHSWAFVPQPSPAPSIVYCGNDGGLDVSVDGGATWNPVNSGGLQTGLFYNIDIRPDATASVTVGALQDNAVETTKGSVGLGWRATQGGDGWDVAYDSTIAGRVYCTSGFWSPAPCTRVHRSTNDGASFPTEITPWGTTSDSGCYLAPITTDPSTGDIVYVSGSQNLWQSTDGGGTWRILSPFPGTGNIDVAAANGNNVVIAVGNQVFVSTNALATTGVVFTDITRNLPSRNVARALFDPVDPSAIYAVLGGFNGSGAGQSGHVFRTTLGASAWTDISPALNLPFNALALDGDDTPTTLYAGTDFGVLRSVDLGATWSILDDIHFPRVPVLDLVLRAGVLRAATYGRGVFQFVQPAAPAIAVNLQNDLIFGTVCTGPAFLTLQIFNVGTKNLVINSVQRLMGSTAFVVVPMPGTPLVIEPGEEVDFTVAYIPSGPGATDLATIRIASNEPTSPVVDLTAFGVGGKSVLKTVIAANGNFGHTCIGSFVDELLTINNGGTCPLSINGIVSSSPDFITPEVLAYPLLVNAGTSIDVVVRFQPAAFGAHSATLTIFSNDPSGAKTVNVTGVAEVPRLTLTMADTGNFGKTCVGSFRDEELILNNSGKCPLSVTGIASSSAEFLVPEVLLYPILIGPGDSFEAPIRFEPANLGAKSGTITVTSDDPLGPRTLAVSGFAPPGKLAVTGSTIFGAVRCDRRVLRTIAVCNVGDCDLHVTEVKLKYKRRHLRLINNPFPATLRPGSCLDLTLQYVAREREPRCSELIIHSDDPETPVKCLEVIAYTVCCPEHECCEEHRKPCCCDEHGRKHHEHKHEQDEE